ncbi:MAG: peptidase M16 [Anaerolineaceae bacterium]|jgi:Zn-dependent M16 (insulinase) family peptidase|nr:MAG: peptidase M16 [Anaerolineaceae bacterium]
MSKSFTLIKEQQIPEINSLARLYEHKRTGARLLSVINDDENKVFSINFRTTPKDSTGVAHILEHSVLGGSEKYPVKEPFVELLKGSLATFVNAFTYPDKTCYPVASQNEKDFYNLIDVYMDAALHPRITEETLMQEGWHYEINDPSEPLTFKGVVFNEMKGAYSSPENLLARTIQQSLFPKHIYGVDSGGDPANIPDLTYENFHAFWESYYHPSNAFIFFYGNDDPEKRLKLMEGYLKPFKKKKVKSAVPPGKPFKRPKKIETAYIASEGEDLDKKHYLTVNWKLPDTSDPVLNLSFQILAHALIGTPASPLKKALMDSGLGEDLAGIGLESDLREMIFSTGLKGTRARHAKKIETLIFETLQALVRDRMDPDTIAASLNTIEFALRENNTGAFPRGIALMLRALTTWLHDDDAFKLLAFEAPLQEVKDRLTSDPRYFERMIQTHLIENPHRTTLRFKPDPELGRRFEEQEQTRLKSAREAMSEDDIRRHVENTRKLKQLQETPDSPEALASIPTLDLQDLDKRVKTIPIEEIQVQDAKVLYHDIFTNGILYLDLAFDLRAMPQDLLPLTDIFARALFEMGTETEDFVKLSQRIGKSTGGIHGSSVGVTTQTSRETRAMLMIRGKSTVSQTNEMLDILRDVLLTAKFDDRERFKQIVLEEKAELESALAPAGHRFANMRLRGQFGGAGWITDQTKGIGYLFALRELARDVDKNWKKALAKLEAMREALINCKTLTVNATLDAANWKSIQPHVENFIFAMPVKDIQLSPFNIQPATRKEGLAIPAQVNYVGKGANLYDLGYEFDGSSQVVIGYLGMTHLWEKIRVQGGAYGAFAQFDDATGVLTFLSYRDPNLAATIKNYDSAAAFLKGLDSSRLSESELKKAIIAAIGDLDAYQLPDAKGYTSMMRYFTGRTDELRQKIRDEALSTNGEDFIHFGEALEKAGHSDAVVVVGSQSALAGAGLGLTVTKVA